MEEGSQKRGLKKRNFRDAFEVMMSGSKKLFRKKNAFEVMMEASAAGAFNKPITNWLDRVPTPTIPEPEYRFGIWSDVNFNPDINLDYNLEVDLEEYEEENDAWEVQVNKTRENVVVETAQVPTKPDFILRSISVHDRGDTVTTYINRITYRKVCGLSMRYSNGTEICIGNLRGTNEKTLDLEEGEHIISVISTYVNHNLFSKGGNLVSMSFVTNSGRKWKSFNSGGINGDDSSQLKKIGWKVPAGKMISQIKFDGDSYGTIEVKCEVVSTSLLKKKSKVPSLVKLVHTALVNMISKESIEAERHYAIELENIRDEDRKTIESISQKARDDILQSDTAKEVLKLRALLANAEAQLAALQSKHIRQLSKTVSYLQKEHKKKHVQVMKDRGMARSQLREKTSVVASLSGIKSMCNNIGCGVIFDPSKTPWRKRCSFAGCESLQKECGCSVSLCWRCHDPICSRHRNIHESQCEINVENRCGYCEDDDVIRIECCGTNIAGKHSCRCKYCGTICCVQCYEECERCGGAWCKYCIKEGHFNPGDGDGCEDCDY